MDGGSRAIGSRPCNEGAAAAEYTTSCIPTLVLPMPRFTNASICPIAVLLCLCICLRLSRMHAVAHACPRSLLAVPLGAVPSDALRLVPLLNPRSFVPLLVATRLPPVRRAKRSAASYARPNQMCLCLMKWT